jgi:hypothetical protein
LDELDIAFAGIVSGAVVGVTAPIVAWLIARANRGHERQLAHQARVFQQRGDVYVDLLEYCYREARAIERMGIGEEPDASEPTEAEVERLSARVSAFGSAAVLRQYQAFVKAATTHSRHLYFLKLEYTGKPAVGKPFEEMHRNRERLKAEFDELEQLVRSELTSLP